MARHAARSRSSGGPRTASASAAPASSLARRLAVLGILFAALVGVIVLKSGQATSPAVQGIPSPRADEAPAAPAAALPAGQVRLVDLGADRCIPCKAMAPILEELRQEYAGVMQVVFIDVWKNPAAGDPYDIYSIPTQIFFDASGRELHRHQGFISKADILATWQRLGITLTPTKRPSGV